MSTDIFVLHRPGAEIGRQAWLRAMCPLGRVGSSPALGTLAKGGRLPSTYPGGEIGRRAVLRRLCLRACWFESSSGYESLGFARAFNFHAFYRPKNILIEARMLCCSYLCIVVVKNIFGAPSISASIGSVQRPFVMSGPCSAESREQVLATAKALANSKKIHLFRAGIWKPRTRPNAFEGVGQIGLEWLQEVRQTTGLPVATEVANAQHVEACMEAGLDVLWIGARTTVSPFAVQEIADALRGTGIPVFVKNPMHADLKLWIGAIERILASVGGPVWAMHRGFSSYGLKEYRNAPMWEIPIGLRSVLPEIPVLCDPSHIAGKRNLVHVVAQKAMDLGMHGLMIETHNQPEQAWSDAEQQITPQSLLTLIDELTIREVHAQPEHSSGLESLRLQMDSLDEQLIELLNARMNLAKEIGRFKLEHGMTILQMERWKEVIETRGGWADRWGLGPTFISNLLEQLHKESIRVQNEEMIQNSKATSI